MSHQVVSLSWHASQTCMMYHVQWEGTNEQEKANLDLSVKLVIDYNVALHVEVIQKQACNCILAFGEVKFFFFFFALLQGPVSGFCRWVFFSPRCFSITAWGWLETWVDSWMIPGDSSISCHPLVKWWVLSFVWVTDKSFKQKLSWNLTHSVCVALLRGVPKLRTVLACYPVLLSVQW